MRDYSPDFEDDYAQIRRAAASRTKSQQPNQTSKMGDQFQRLCRQIADIVSDRLTRTDKEVQAVSARVSSLEAVTKYLIPSAQLGQLASVEPEIIAAKDDAKKLRLQLKMARNAIKRQEQKAELGEKAIAALRDQIKAMSKANTMTLDPTIAFNPERRPVTTLKLKRQKPIRKPRVTDLKKRTHTGPARLIKRRAR